MVDEVSLARLIFWVPLEAVIDTLVIVLLFVDSNTHTCQIEGHRLDWELAHLRLTNPLSLQRQHTGTAPEDLRSGMAVRNPSDCKQSVVTVRAVRALGPRGRYDCWIVRRAYERVEQTR